MRVRVARRARLAKERTMAGVYGEIHSRADFARVLDAALREGHALLAKQPGDPTIAVIVRQLEQIKAWTANDRTPTSDERRAIDIALRAAREFEGDREKYGW